VNTHTIRRFVILGSALLLAIIGSTRMPMAAADDPKAQPRDAKTKPDALPTGAKLRLGDHRLAFRFAPSLTLLPPDYKTFVIPDGIDKLRQYVIATGEPLDKTPSRNNGSFQVVISADGKRFVHNATGVMTVRETATGKVVQQLKLPGGFQTAYSTNAPAVSLSADGKVAAQGGQGQAAGANAKGGVVVWNVETGDMLFQGGVPANGPALPMLSPDGKLVALRSAGFGAFNPAAKPEDDPRHSIWVYEVDGGKELLHARVTPGGYQGIHSVVFSPDGSELAASCGDGVVEVWGVKTGKARPPILGRNGQGVRLAISPDSKTLGAVAADGAIQRWAIADGKPLSTTDGPVIQVTQPTSLVFASNDRLLASGSVGQCPVVWEAPSGKVLTPIPEHTQGIKSIAFAASGKEILTAGLDGHIVRWDATTGKVIGPVNLRPSRLVSPNSRIIANLTADGTKAISTGTFAAVFDLATGSEEFALPRGNTGTQTSSSSPSGDGTKVIVMAIPYDQKKTGKCTVWDVTTRQKINEVDVTGSTGSQPSAAISPSGNRLVIAAHHSNPTGGQQSLVITGWDLKTGKKLGQIEDVDAKGMAFVAAASDSFAVVHSGTGRIRAYDYATGRGGDVLEAGKQFGESVTGPVVFTADGKGFVSSGPGTEYGAYEVRIHEWPTGKVLHTFTGLRAPVSAMVFSPDGKTLATGSQDATVLLWDMAEVK
jgi:WD40 repeat protein